MVVVFTPRVAPSVGKLSEGCPGSFLDGGPTLPFGGSIFWGAFPTHFWSIPFSSGEGSLVGQTSIYLGVLRYAPRPSADSVPFDTRTEPLPPKS